LGELFNVQADVSSTVMLAAAGVLTMGMHSFFRLDHEVWKNPPCLFVFPLSEIEHPSL
jgi:hypothetical protein